MGTTHWGELAVVCLLAAGLIGYCLFLVWNHFQIEIALRRRQKTFEKILSLTKPEKSAPPEKAEHSMNRALAQYHEDTDEIHRLINRV